MTIDEFLSHLENPRKAGAGYSCRCPSHDDKKNSLSVNQADEKILVKCHAGCATETILDALGLAMTDLFASNGNGRGHSGAHDQIVDRYVYTDEAGNPLYRVCRTAAKDFFQERFESGVYLPGVKGIRRVLYNLPSVLKARAVFVVEGEKDVETLRALGLVATTNAGGAEKWLDSYAESFKNKHVAIIPDNDQPGRRHGWKVAKSIIGVADIVKLVELPGLPDKGDVTDYLKDHTKEELLAAAKAAQALKAEDIGEHDTEAAGDADSTHTHSTQPNDGGRDGSTQLKPILSEKALYGVAGEIVRAVEPYSEADRVSLLLNAITAYGNIIGCSSYAAVNHDEHPARINVIQVGPTSKGRKGTGWSEIRYLFSQVDSDWSKHRVKTGLSSGEGLIFNVRDPIYRQEPIKEKGRVVDYQQVQVDPGEKDKRLLIVEPEFASTLTVMAREGNILSGSIRQAWDDGNLSPLTKKDPITATNAHISIIGHITSHELLSRLDETSKANGFANRFLWALVSRSKELPEGAETPPEIMADLAEKLARPIDFARKGWIVRRNDDARAVWAAVYGPLSAGKPGLTGAICSRAEAQVLRLSIIYALLDSSSLVTVDHLEAALALWEYCEVSARIIFGKKLGDPVADKILDAIREVGAAGMTDKDIYDLFGGHRSTNERDRALTYLKDLGLIVSTQVATGGRPKTVWLTA